MTLQCTRLVITLLALMLVHYSYGQVQPSFDLQSFVEKRFNDQQEGLNYEELYERLLLLYENPIDLNTANEEELMNLGLLSATQIDSFIQYQLENGRILTLYELQYIEEFDLATITSILPFVTLTNRSKSDLPLLKRILAERNNYLIMRYERILEKKRGYGINEGDDQSRYLGSADKTYLRYKVSKAGDFSFGFTTEKDAGEQIIWDPSTRKFGNDFWSAHGLVEKQGRWRKIIIGDYQLQFGQGLVFGSGFAMGKGSETVNTLERVNRGISPYTSVIEGGFLRGIATTYEISPKLTTTIFLSRLNQSANLRVGSEDTFVNYFSSIQLTGLHRTDTEIENRQSIHEKVYGLELHYTSDQRSKFGVIAAANNFSIPVLRSNQPYNYFEFTGKENVNLSVYGNTQWQRFQLFGEMALSKSGGLGSLGGFTSRLSKRIDLSMVVRNYDRNFHSIRGSSFAEGSRNINESGIYWGIKYKLNSQFNLTAYYDSFRFPWLRFRINKPSTGSDYLVRLNLAPNRLVKSYFQLRGKRKAENRTITETNQTEVRLSRSMQYLLNTRYSISSALSGQTRAQYSSYDIGGENTFGYGMMQDIIYTTPKLSISSRMALFDTEGQQNRQYAYERDVLYAFSIPGYSGQGIRNYLLFSYRMTPHIDIWARIARTTFYDRNEIGTGLETIIGNKRTDVKFQIRYKMR